MDEARAGGLGSVGYRSRPFRLHGVEALAAPFEQYPDQIDDHAGVAHRRLDRLRKAQIGLNRMDLPDPAERLQMEGQLRPAHGDADEVAAVGKRADHVAAEESRAAEHGDQRVKLAFQGHRLRAYRIDFAMYRAIIPLPSGKGNAQSAGLFVKPPSTGAGAIAFN